MFLKEENQVDTKVSEINIYLFYSFYYYFSHGYSCLLSAIQGMCAMITLALTSVLSVRHGDSTQQKGNSK